jgi:hypothetical protein
MNYQELGIRNKELGIRIGNYELSGIRNKEL